MSWKATLVGTTLLALGAGAAVAQPRDFGGMMGGGARPTFEQLDADGDGRLTQAEIQSHATERMQAVDANSDGNLSAEEIVSHMQEERRAAMLERVQRMIDSRDENGDGLIAIGLMMPDEAGGRMFDRMDRDEDGAVTADEFAAAQERMEGRRGRGASRDGHGHGGGHGRSGGQMGDRHHGMGGHDGAGDHQGRPASGDQDGPRGPGDRPAE